jgi:anti-sigma factor RsiW/streptogramin lyase
MHLSDELLSAYLDGELTPAEATAAAAHLRSCAACGETAGLFGALDERLTAIPALVCSAALTLVSAQLDGELAGEESTIAAAHLAGCDSCREDVLRWSVADQAIASLPAARPSLAVDAAIASLGRTTRTTGARRPRLGFTWPVPALAAAMAIALVISLNVQRPASPEIAFVASVQVSVLNPATNVLYVLHPEQGTVSAIDATTFVEKSVITVGGRPTALALNSANNSILVLDPSAKTVTEIDCAQNTVTSSTAVQVPGTPTSLQVDPNGKLVVTSVVAPAPSSPAAPAGAISLFNSGTKQLETVKTVDVAPSLLVVDPSGSRALLVSKDGTTLVDAGTYQSIARYGGGLAAAFGAGGDLAILSAAGDGATVSLTRQGTAITVGGTPRAITALSGGGYAVLTDAGARGRIVLLSADGAVTGSIDTALGGRDLKFDAATRQLAVVGAGGVSNLPVPSEALAASKPAPTTTAPAIVPGPSQPSAATIPAPSASPAAQVAPPADAHPITVVAPSDGKVPTGARAVWPGTYLVTIATQPTVVTSDADRIWFVDGANQVKSLHMRSGEQYTLTHLPASASIGRIAVSPNHVYLTDTAARLMYVLTIGTEQVSTVPLPFLAITNDIVASPDERLWLGTRGLGLVSFDPRSNRLESAGAVQDVSAVATDPLGRIWMGVPGRQVLDVFDPLTDKITELSLPHDGTISALAIDREGTIWAGTDTGQLFAIRNGRLQGSAALGRPIDDLLIDAAGQAWFVTRTATEVLYGLAVGNGITVHAPGTASGPLFDALGRAWQADASAGGFYVTLSPGAQP